MDVLRQCDDEPTPERIEALALLSVSPPLGTDDAVLFLDFDGVTHPEGCKADRQFVRLPAIEAVIAGYPLLRVVVSSTWRARRTVWELIDLFDSSVRMQVIGKTTTLRDVESHVRMRECQHWLRAYAHPWTRWIAIDDQPWLFKPFCSNLISVPWLGEGIEAAQLTELDSKLRGFW